MILTKLISRAIEKKLNLPPLSYELTGKIDNAPCLIRKDEQTGSISRSMVEIDDIETPIFQGDVIFMYDSFTNKGPYFHKIIANPTLVDILIAFDQGIKFSGDSHHLYLEDLIVIDDHEQYFSDFMPDFEKPIMAGAILVSIQSGS